MQRYMGLDRSETLSLCPGFGFGFSVLPDEGFGLRVEEFGLRTEEFGLRTEEFKLRTEEFRLRKEESGLRAEEFGLRKEEFGLRREEFGLQYVVGWTGSGTKYRLWGSTVVLV